MTSTRTAWIVVRELAEIVEIHGLETEVLAASIRNPRHMTQAALAGAHVATLPFKVLQQMVHHPLTDKGIVAVQEGLDRRPRGRGRPGDVGRQGLIERCPGTSSSAT